jgi:hypothetical protein
MDFPTLIEIPTLDYTIIEEAQPSDYTIDYDRDLDTLFIYWKTKPDLAVCHYLEDGVYALYDPATLKSLVFRLRNSGGYSLCAMKTLATLGTRRLCSGEPAPGKS